MSKTYIVSRNGGTVTKAPINDNKIPIYANETALDADLSNLPDGTICATSGGHDDVIDQMKDYIRKQNVLSDWEEITWTNTTAGAYEAQYDGFIHFGLNNSYWTKVLISTDGGTTFTDLDLVVQGGGTNIDTGCSSEIPIKKGWKFYCTAYANRTPTSAHAVFYKNRDYTGR